MRGAELRLQFTIGALAILVLGGAIGFWFGHQEGMRDFQAKLDETGISTGYDFTVPASSVDEKHLQALAIASCECERSGTSEGKCWSEYKSATARYTVSGVATACYPISTEMDCIATSEGEKCVVTGYGRAGVCTQQEAVAVEIAYNEAFKKVTGGRENSDDSTMRIASDAANAAVDAMIARIRRGERIAHANSEGGCAG